MTSVLNPAWVRCRGDGLHDITCERCGVTLAAGLRDYRTALRVANAHQCEGEER